MKKQILKYTLSFFVILFAYLSWSFESRVFDVSDSSRFILPIIFFSFLVISTYLSAVIIKEKYFLILLLLVSFSISLIFAIYFWHLVLIALSVFFASIGVFKIRRDMNLNIKINLGKTIGTGRQLLMLAIAITVTSQYYVAIKNKEALDIIPRIENMSYTNTLINKILSSINPNFKNISNESLTVDQFIIDSQKNQTEGSETSLIDNQQVDAMINDQLGSNASPWQKEAIRNDTLKKLETMNSQVLDTNQRLILEESRKKMSELAGKQLTGQEKMSDVFSEMINNKISDFFRAKNVDKNSMPVLPMVLSIILFLSVYSLGSFLNIFWTFISRLIFWILVKSKAITIVKIQKEVDAIE